MLPSRTVPAAPAAVRPESPRWRVGVPTPGRDGSELSSCVPCLTPRADPPPMPAGRARRRPAADRSLLGKGFAIGVATSGFQVEGGYNGPGQPANNWAALGTLGTGAAFGRGVRLLGPPRGGAGPGGGHRVHHVPSLRRVGPPRARGRTVRRGRAGPLRRDSRDVRLAPSRAHDHPPPLHPPRAGWARSSGCDPGRRTSSCATCSACCPRWRHTATAG